MRSAGIILLVFALAACSTPQTNAAPVPIEVWLGSDVGLALRMRDKLEKAVPRSREFILAGSGEGLFQIYINGNADEVATNRYRLYVDFYRGLPTNRQRIGESRPVCLEHQMSHCAAVVLADARRLAANLGNRGASSR